MCELMAWHDRGTAWARHAMCELAFNCIQDHTAQTSWQWRVSNPHTLSPLSAIISLPKAICSFIKTVTYLLYTSLWQFYPLHMSLNISHQNQQW